MALFAEAARISPGQKALMDQNIRHMTEQRLVVLCEGRDSLALALTQVLSNERQAQDVYSSEQPL